MTEKKWSIIEIKSLKDLYIDKCMPTDNIAKIIGRTKCAVLGKIKILGLHRENIWGKLDYD